MHVKSGLLLLATVMVSGGSAGAHCPTTIDVETFTGKQAATSFSVTATVTCANQSSGSVSATGFLSGADQVTRQTGQPKSASNGILVEIDTYSNSCTGTFLDFATGGISGGFTPPSSRLNSAQLAGSTTVQDLDTGAQFPVAIDVVFEGTGPISKDRSHSITRTVTTKHGPVTITIDSAADSSRAATASGTITIEGFELDPTFTSTSLVDNSSSQITITRQ